LRLALALSALTHLVLAAALESGAPPRNARDVGILPLDVRLELLREAASGADAALDREAPVEAHAAMRDTASSEDARPPASSLTQSAKARDADQQPVLPEVPDATVYEARDLDSYPRPVVPLDFGRVVGLSAGHAFAALRFELIIDELGVVNHVAFVQSVPPGHADERLRGLLAVARFVPAYKDQRAVKSRVVLSINLGTSDP
jgi:hypothetical protein